MTSKVKGTLIFFAFLCSGCYQTPFDSNDGPLTAEEIQYFYADMKDAINNDAMADCLLEEATARARAVGDPETLDPTTVEMLPVEHWSELDKTQKRVSLAQVVFSQAAMPCAKKTKSP